VHMKLFAILLLIASFVGWSKLAYSTSARSNGEQERRDLAVLLHNRIVGVPARGETLQEMVALLKKGKIEEAALLATEHPFFYDFKLRALFNPWSNREGSVSGDLNDMVMTMIGMVRDDLPFDKVLSADLHYAIREDAPTEGAAETQPDPTKATPSSLKSSLQQHKQSEKLHKDREPDLISGVLSTNAFARAFYSAGTNRRATAFVLKNFLCHEMEQLHDTETPKHWVRQDVSRSPGGDPELFNQRCVGCHAGMDALSGWSVFYDYDGSTITWDKNVKNKIFKNVLHEGSQGRNYMQAVNQNNSFTNLWTEGKNAKLGWRGKTSGEGAKEFGEMMTKSKAFASCMARQVYESVCYLKPDAGMAKTKSEQLAEQFEKNNYNMRKLFAATAVSCLTQKKEKNTQAGGEETSEEN